MLEPFAALLEPFADFPPLGDRVDDGRDFDDILTAFEDDWDVRPDSYDPEPGCFVPFGGPVLVGGQSTGQQPTTTQQWETDLSSFCTPDVLGCAPRACEVGPRVRTANNVLVAHPTSASKSRKRRLESALLARTKHAQPHDRPWSASPPPPHVPAFKLYDVNLFAGPRNMWDAAKARRFDAAQRLKAKKSSGRWKMPPTRCRVRTKSAGTEQARPRTGKGQFAKTVKITWVSANEFS